jgi:Flp pilus assembly protein TadG
MQFKLRSSIAASAARGRGFLARLARDARGNTLAIVGAALVPLSAMIGSGVDMSRAYMAKSRLQNACDAAALAGRRVMQNDQMSQTVQDEAVRFFNFNFNQGLYGTDTFTPVVTRSAPGTIRVTASTRIPTTIMKMFGFTTLPLNVTCDAALNFVNTDVMLVLDVTGSMAADINGNYFGGNSKIEGLRDAVMALYDELAPTQAQLEANGLRLRYGIVPYSSTVNVGSLIRAIDSNFIANNVTYQSRVANFDERHTQYVGTPQTPDPPVTQTYGSSISQSDCDKYGRNVSFSGFSPSAASGGGPAPTPSWSRSFSNNEASGVDWSWSGAPDTSGTNRSCRRRYVETDTTYQTVEWYESSGWVYKPEVLDVTQYKTGGSITVASSDNGQSPVQGDFDPIELPGQVTGESTTSISWNGCIEERATVSTITSTSGYTIPPTAYDLDINLVPTNDNTRWRPMIPDLEYRRSNSGSTEANNGTSMTGAACPAAARRLQAWTRNDMLNYVNALTPTGSTYHDIGMIWGARLLSNAGVFAADNPNNFNSMPVSRHIIFMTDGQMDTDRNVYGFHGVEWNDWRVGGGSFNTNDIDLNSRHMQRFKMICNAAKGMGFSVWVIAFGTTLSSEMQECASNPSQASTSTSSADLIARFRQIGSNIGALRLTQ